MTNEPYHCGLADVFAKTGATGFIMAAYSLDEWAAIPPADLEELIKEFRGKAQDTEAFNLGLMVGVLSMLHARQVRLLKRDEAGAAALLENAAMILLLCKWNA